jgi:hypothetical protein
MRIHVEGEALPRVPELRRTVVTGTPSAIFTLA